MTQEELNQVLKKYENAKPLDNGRWTNKD
jgi:hypothetical protein